MSAFYGNKHKGFYDFFVVIFIRPSPLKKAFLFLFVLSSTYSFCQERSVARAFIETSLQMIKEDGSGPTVIARNLFHTSAAMYDTWSLYQDNHTPFLLGQAKGDFKSDFDMKFRLPDSLKTKEAIDEAISYAAYRMLVQKFSEINGKRRTIDIIDSTFSSLGYDHSYRDMNYKSGKAADIGNYVAHNYIQFGLTDGSLEDAEYEDFSFQSVNSMLTLSKSGNKGLEHKNRWQPISAIEYINQKGIDKTLIDWNMLLADHEGQFLTPQWGKVVPFAMEESDKSFYERDGESFPVYFDPSPPPQLDFDKDSIQSEEYKWGFVLVALWSSYLDPANSVKIDISPASRGNIVNSASDLEKYYQSHRGEVIQNGHKINPKTNKPYAKNMVKKADYTRVIAEFWVDGINTYSPPGHWFEMLNQVTDHPDQERKWNGKGESLDPLEWDIKTYFALGGALHDAAIAAWGVKVAYDYVRPISAIRYMAGKGQSSDTSLPNYHLEGLPLIEGKIELVTANDKLAKQDQKNIGKVKIYAWKGPNYINDVEEEIAGVDWILAEDWWPYQRYSFVTPPFSGYVSGHSCFSFAGATMLERITGDSYFPGGIAGFTARKNEFLLFEDGPSEDVTLQWATYRDAATETCLSRIWGGIHPPHDDMMGRVIGEKVGEKAFQKIQTHFDN